MSQTMKTTDVIGLGFMTFAFFLGAGNIIFPPMAGFLAGEQMGWAMLGFLVMAPMRAGQAEWYWQLAGRKENRVGNVFGWLGSPHLAARSLALALRLLCAWHCGRCSFFVCRLR